MWFDFSHPTVFAFLGGEKAQRGGLFADTTNDVVVWICCPIGKLVDDEQKMIWKVELFEATRGEKPVEEFIKLQNSSVRAKLTHEIELLEIHGSMLGMPQSKRLEAGLYELRIRGKDGLRIFYCFKFKTIYLLHGFKKKTQQIPIKEMEIARQRKIVIDKL